MRTVKINGVEWLTTNLKEGNKIFFSYEEAINACKGKPFRLPTVKEVETLLDESKVTRRWVEGNPGGYEFTDKSNNNSLFLHAFGVFNYSDGECRWGGIDGNYRCITNGMWDAPKLSFNNTDIEINGHGIKSCFSVRCVAEN